MTGRDGTTKDYILLAEGAKSAPVYVADELSGKPYNRVITGIQRPHNEQISI